MKNVLVAGSIHPDGLALLQEATGLNIQYVTEVSTQSMLPFIEDAHALLIRTQALPASYIDKAKNLEIVSRHGVGYDAVDIDALNKRNIPLTIVGDVNSRSVAEHAITLILAAARRIVLFDDKIRHGDWNYRNSLDASEVDGKTLLIIGFGRIGKRVAQIANALSMRVVVFDTFVDEADIRQYQCEPVATLDGGLRQADIVTLHIPSNSKVPLIGANELAVIKKGAILVNTARGSLIDEQALVKSLNCGHLTAAALDVLNDEPPHVDNPLLANKRVILTPHNAGLSEETACRMAKAAAKNILDYFDGQLNPNLVVNKFSSVIG
ncbi:hydroxyacid dehydrogenase [Bartonella sp. HY329]|uniref:hydroxyacid dehydrogenase n=1 Tax=unclassified Bartonella TaxID=2645622 RepID=UPI0021C6747C|nr:MULTISPECIES: hydroxyacid dehydrogenase [unclassified Bartonella]UXM94417.1 hydroxyacid dehydrogenase [Bartonella sp. HY329]UXN08741.1 hydroxyacid dehydrogenase [Bartonella sp. HY328]